MNVDCTLCNCDVSQVTTLVNNTVSLIFYLKKLFMIDIDKICLFFFNIFLQIQIIVWFFVAGIVKCVIKYTNVSHEKFINWRKCIYHQHKSL